MLIQMTIAVILMATTEGAPPKTAAGITPIPFDKINPRANEFRRLDTDGDEQITFTEFILGDHRYIERQSAAFHKLDEDGDGVVSRGEYDAYYKRIDDERRRNDMERERFFEGLDRVRHDHFPFSSGFSPSSTHHYVKRSPEDIDSNISFYYYH
ncbi:EF hand [Trichostrongylus colubriformis]|uniref:EF hand n=1 Tax=Trichostrongylus colubriformis TaxID=6319 RepID=A0AAN8IB79_TRICO